MSFQLILHVHCVVFTKIKFEKERMLKHLRKVTANGKSLEISKGNYTGFEKEYPAVFLSNTCNSTSLRYVPVFLKVGGGK